MCLSMTQDCKVKAFFPLSKPGAPGKYSRLLSIGHDLGNAAGSDVVINLLMRQMLDNALHNLWQ